MSVCEYMSLCVCVIYEYVNVCRCVWREDEFLFHRIIR